MDRGSENQSPPPESVSPSLKPVPKATETHHPGMKGFFRRLFRGEIPGPRNPAGPNPLLENAMHTHNTDPYHPSNPNHIQQSGEGDTQQAADEAKITTIQEEIKSLDTKAA